MLEKAVIQEGYKKTFNKGSFLSAKIYSDIRGNNCKCGGKFSEKETIKGYEVPVCGTCKENPTLFRINAKIIDANGVKKVISIRHNQSNERLVDVIDVMSCLKRIKEEIEEGVFDIRRYDSKQSKESFLFKNFTESYINHHENRLKRNEITIEGIRDKKFLINKYINPFFGKMYINKVNPIKIDDFKDSFTEKFRTRDKALAELRTILRFAHKKEMINSVPHFEIIPRSKQRKEVATIEEVKKVLPHVNEYYQDAFKILAIYPIRPSELRCLRWVDVDFKESTITIQRHMSGSEEIKGRKSLKDGHDKSIIVYPLTSDAILILKSKPHAINKDLLIFPSKAGHNKVMSKNALPENWNKACDKAGVKRFHSYEIKHARITEITELSGGNMVEVMAASGHTNINTVMRYSKGKAKLDKIFH